VREQREAETPATICVDDADLGDPAAHAVLLAEGKAGDLTHAQSDEPQRRVEGKDVAVRLSALLPEPRGSLVGVTPVARERLSPRTVERVVLDSSLGERLDVDPVRPFGTDRISSDAILIWRK
jgi:hypothetical protein